MKDRVVIDPAIISAAPKDHRNHVIERGVRVGGLLADQMGIAFAGIQEPTHGDYPIFGSPIRRGRADELAITRRSDFFGAVTNHDGEIHKTIFHPSISGLYTPTTHSDALAAELTTSGVVLPGITAYRIEDLMQFYSDVLPKDITYRLKISNGSDGEGQYGNIRTHADLLKAVHSVGGDKIAKTGLILEQEIPNPQTISVGSIELNGEEYSYVLHQKDEVIRGANGEKRTRYLGASDITVFRGSIADIATRPGTPEAFAQQKAEDFIRIYGDHSSALLSRISLDVVMNEAGTVGGVTDLTTGRIGGTDPGLLMAIGELQQDPSLINVVAEVVLDYERKLSIPDGAIVFVDQPDLRLFAQVTGKTRAIS